jgi:nucleoside-diphosphate-sugar epimerase
MRVLVAGGTGLFGVPTVRRLLAAGHDVTLLARPAHREAPAGVGLEIVDLRNEDAVRSVVSRLRPEAIVSLVSSLPKKIDFNDMGADYRRNDSIRNAATVHLTQAARDVSAHIVAASVAFWYAPGDGLATEEDPLWFDAPAPIAGAVWSLIALETAVGLAGGTVIRHGTPIGPGTYHARDGYVGNILSKGLHPIFSGALGITSFAHVEDVASATVHALDIPRGVYNAVDDDPVEYNVWIRELTAAYGGPPPRIIPEIAARLAFKRAVIEWMIVGRGASNAKLRATGWEPAFPSWRKTTI